MATLVTFESSRLRQPHVVGCNRVVFCGSVQQGKGVISQSDSSKTWYALRFSYQSFTNNFMQTTDTEYSFSGSTETMVGADNGKDT